MVLFLFNLAWAGGWTQPAKGHYVKMGGRALPGSTFFADGGDSTELPPQSYLDFALELYGEYGLTDGWTLIGQAIPIGFASVGTQQTAYTGVYQVGVRRRLVTGQHNLSVQLDIGYTPPLGEVDLFTDPPEGDGGLTYRYLPTQSGAQADLLLGYGVGIKQLWISGQAGAMGFTNRDIAPAVMGYAQVGYTLPKNNRLMLTVPFRQHLFAKPDTNLAGSGQTDFVGFRLEAELTFGKSGWGLMSGGAGAFYASANEASPATIPLYVTHTSTN